MFNSIKGIYRGYRGNVIFIETYGIEWEILVSNFTLNNISEGDEIKIYTHLQHREDVMQLFGFYAIKERLMFLDLIKVEGIGPKQAIKILSSISLDDLEVALDNGDIDKLQTISGVGKKTAQKMALALKGKLTLEDGNASGKVGGVKSEYEDIIKALLEMGYDRKKCIEATQNISEAMKKEGRDPLKNETDFMRRLIMSLT